MIIVNEVLYYFIVYISTDTWPVSNYRKMSSLKNEIEEFE